MNYEQISEKEKEPGRQVQHSLYRDTVTCSYVRTDCTVV